MPRCRFVLVTVLAVLLASCDAPRDPHSGRPTTPTVRATATTTPRVFRVFIPGPNLYAAPPSAQRLPTAWRTRTGGDGTSAPEDATPAGRGGPRAALIEVTVGPDGAVIAARVVASAAPALPDDDAIRQAMSMRFDERNVPRPRP